MNNAYNLIAQTREKTGLSFLDLRVLLCHLTGWTTAQLITRDKQDLDDAIAEQFIELTQRRQQGEPIAYLTGKREFYRRDFSVNAHTLIPRPETEELIDLVLGCWPADKPARVLDVGTGSGVIAITLKKERPLWEVYASDISPLALDTAKHNALALDATIQFIRSDYFDHLPTELRFDLIVSNPPYIASGDKHLEEGDLRFEPKEALTDFQDGLKAYRILSGQGKAWLEPDGLMAVEHGYDQQSQILALFTAQGWNDINGYDDLAGQPRMVSCRA